MVMVMMMTVMMVIAMGMMTALVKNSKDPARGWVTAGGLFTYAWVLFYVGTWETAVATATVPAGCETAEVTGGQGVPANVKRSHGE